MPQEDQNPATKEQTPNSKEDEFPDYFEDEKVRKPKGKKILKMRKNW